MKIHEWEIHKVEAMPDHVYVTFRRPRSNGSYQHMIVKMKIGEADSLAQALVRKAGSVPYI